MLAQKLRKSIFSNMYQHGSSYKKTFGNFVNLSLLIKSPNFEDIIRFVENVKVVSVNEEMLYLFNTQFSDITKGLNIRIRQCSNHPCEDSLVDAIRKYEMHFGIFKIKSLFTLIKLFDFSFCKQL